LIGGIVADDLIQRSSQDCRRIDTSEDYELRAWAKKFGVTPERVKVAVQAVGNDAEKVGRHLYVARVLTRLGA